MADISAFKSQMIQGGARANQFKVEITFPATIPGGALAGQKLQFLAKSAQLPQSSVADVAVMYRGRPVHFAGEREFSPWSIDVYNDNDFSVRNAFEAWVDSIQNAENTNGLLTPSLYQVDMSVIQLDRSDREVKRYTFKDAWPTDVGAIQLDWESNNQIEIFSVTFQYNFWTSPSSQGALG
jgi:T4-like virus tail tube protein gp19